MQGWCRALSGALVVSIAVPGLAQTAPESPPLAATAPAAVAAPDSATIAVPDPDPAPASTGLRLPTGTPVQFEFVTQLDSKTSKIDAMFPIRLTRPIQLNGTIVIPAGTMGEGQIVHAAKSGWGGKAGELIVAARYIDFNGTHVPLRRFRMGEIETGDDRRDTAFAASAIVSPLLAFVINGGEKSILVGTRANAIVSADTEIPATPAPAAGALATNATLQKEGEVK